MELGVGCEVRVHLTCLVNVLKAVKTRRTLAVDDVLVVTLRLVVGVAEDLTVFGLLGTLGLRQTGVEHVLVVLHEGSVAAELVVETILRVRQNVTLICHGSSVRRATVGLGNLVVFTQVGVEGALTMCRSVVSAKTTGGVANVGVATTTIVDVDNRLRVNVGKVVRGALLQELERA